MAPRGRRKRAGLMREDAARDAMRRFGFQERLISEAIKELLEVYGEDGWKLIEEDSYLVLLNYCLDKTNQQNPEAAQEKQEEEEEEEHDQQAEDVRDQVGSNSTFLVGGGAETGTPQTCQTDAASITSEAVMDSSPAVFQSGDYAPHSVGGAKSSHCGWLSSEEEENDPNEDDDDEMIHLTPEPLCEELEVLLREVRGQKKRKRVSRWDS